jgi:hypothetical protein
MIMGQYYEIVNIDKREYLDPHTMGCGAKLMEWSYNRTEISLALMNLLADRWKGDRVYVVGDYAECDDKKEVWYNTLLGIEKELGFDDLKMAVVFQEYIHGKTSGVIFTADTISMEDSTVCINAAEGECAGFVSGKAKSQEYKVNKKTKEYTLENQNGNILKDVDVRSLLDLSLKIEKVMGYFQDIEWTICKDQIYILQSRNVIAIERLSYHAMGDANLHEPSRLANDTLSNSTFSTVSNINREVVLNFSPS